MRPSPGEQYDRMSDAMGARPVRPPTAAPRPEQREAKTAADVLLSRLRRKPEETGGIASVRIELREIGQKLDRLPSAIRWAVAALVLVCAVGTGAIAGAIIWVSL